MGGQFRLCAANTLKKPIKEAPQSTAKTIPIFYSNIKNLVKPPSAPIINIESNARLGTLNKIANPMAAIPNQIPFSKNNTTSMI